jgi:type IV pilus assembly protein PilN
MIRINLLPVRAEKRKQTLRKHLVFVGAYIACLILVLLSITFTLNNEISRTRSAIAQKKAEIERLDKLIREVEGYEAKIKDLAEKIGVIQALKMRQRGPARVFHELAQICPDKLWIEKLTDKAGLMTIEGYAIDNQTVAQFMTRMEQSPKFKDVRLTVTKQVDKGGVLIKSFVLNVQIVRPVPPAAPPPEAKQADKKG